MNIKLETAFYFLGVFQAIQLLLFGWKNHVSSKNTKPFFNVYLLVFIVCIILELVSAIFDVQDWFGDNFKLLFITNPITVLYGPMIYFYTLSLSTRKLDRPSVLPHLSWFFAWVIIFIPLYFKSELEIFTFFSVEDSDDLYLNIIFILIPLIEVIQLGYYLKKSYSHIKSYQSNLRAFYSYQKDISLNWIKRILYSVIVVAFIYIFIDTIETPITPNLEFDLTDYALVVWVIYFSYSIMLHKDQKIPKEMIENIESLDNSKEVKSNLEQEEISDFEDNILSQQLFLDPDLNLAKLSKSCNITRHRASLLLNEGFKSNFYDYINKLRIDYAKKLLTDTNYKRNILAVTYDSGFKSRSAFYTAFKKWEKQTPSQFLKSISQPLQKVS